MWRTSRSSKTNPTVSGMITCSRNLHELLTSPFSLRPPWPILTCLSSFSGPLVVGVPRNLGTVRLSSVICWPTSLFGVRITFSSLNYETPFISICSLSILSVVDCAEGTARQFALQPKYAVPHVKVQKISKIFITHMHGV